MYELQALQDYPASLIKQIRPNQLTRNNTNLPLRWKGLAVCEEIEPLKKHVINKNRRIINLENFELVYVYGQDDLPSIDWSDPKQKKDFIDYLFNGS